MKKIIYKYSDGTIKEHTCYIKKKTIERESGESKTCNIYEKTTKLEDVFAGEFEPIKEYVTRTKFITTLLLR